MSFSVTPKFIITSFCLKSYFLELLNKFLHVAQCTWSSSGLRRVLTRRPSLFFGVFNEIVWGITVEVYTRTVSGFELFHYPLVSRLLITNECYTQIP